MNGWCGQEQSFIIDIWRVKYMQLNSKQNFNFIEVTQDVEIWDTKMKS